MAAQHYTDSPVPNQISSSPAAQTVPFELVGTGLYILMMCQIQRRHDGSGVRIVRNEICTVALPLAALDRPVQGAHSLQGGAK